MKTSELRAWAEREIMIRGVPSELVDAPAQVLIHEVNLHRTELELQNEELQRTQLELEEERDYRVDLFDLSPVASLILDPSGRVVEANTSASVMLGVPKHVLIRRALAATLSQEDGDRLHLHLRRAFACRTNQSCEVTIERMDGRSIPVRLDSIVLPGRELCPTTLVDVSDLHRAEEEKREATARLGQLTDHLAEVFFIYQPSSGRVVHVSAGFDRMFGFSGSMLLDERCRPLDLVHAADRSKLDRALAEFARGDPLDLELRVVRADLETRLLRVRAARVPGEDRVAGVLVDLTDEREIEEELLHAEKMRVAGALASGIAHDFNNLLMGVVGYASMAMNRLDAESSAYSEVKRAVDIASQGKALTQQLLEFSRTRPSEPESIELDAAVSDCRGLLATLLGESIQIVLRCGAERCRVQAEAGEIEQVLLSFAAHARSSMPNGGTLVLTTRSFDAEGGRCVTISVRDDGAGMDAETKQRIFEPFFTTNGIAEAGGLGLAASLAAVRRMGGRITVESLPGRGTTFVIDLPVLPETTDETVDPTIPMLNGCVLVVEDDESVRESVAYHLKSIGYQALAAADSDGALKLLEQQGDRVRILLTDVNMPHELGRDLASRVRALRPSIRAVYMSAHPKHLLIERGRIEPEALFIQKPFDELRLAITLRRALLESSATAS